MRYLAGASEVRLYQGLDHHVGQPLSPSCQQFFLTTSAPIYHASGPARNPLGPANKGQIPATQAPRCTAHRNASHVPHGECKTSSAPGAHLGGSCALSRQAAARFRPPARTLPRSSRRVDAYLHSAHWFCIRRLRTRVPVYKSEWVAAVLRVEGVRATGTASQESTQSAIESRAVFGKAWSSTSMKEEELVQVSGRQTHRQTQMF